MTQCSATRNPILQVARHCGEAALHQSNKKLDLLSLSSDPHHADSFMLRMMPGSKNVSSTSVDFFLHVHNFVCQVLTKREVESLYGSTEVRTYFSAGYVSDIKLLQIKQLYICLKLIDVASKASPKMPY